MVVAATSDTLWCANAGDSRAVVCRDGVAIPLSFDHKPNSEIESTRITKAGGFVEATNGFFRVNGNLNLSRSIGDHRSRELGVIPEPDIRHHKLCKADKLVIIASDGVCEVMSSQAAVELVSTFTNATEACRALVREAVVCWQEEEGDVYRDDITAIVVFM